MHILMTTDTVGGVWTFTSELTEQLLQAGHSVHLVSFGRLPSPDRKAWANDLDARLSATSNAKLTAENAPTFSYTPSEIPLEWMQGNERAHTDGAALLESILQAQPADLVLSNQFCFGRLSTPTPRVVVAHSDVLSWARACNPAALEPTPWLNRYTSMVQAGLLDATAVTTPTAWMGKALTSTFFLPRNYFVIPNGISVAAAPQPAPARQLQAITAGRLWDEAKGLDTLTDLDPPLPILVAGDNTFDSTADAQPWPTHLTNLGPLSHADLQQHFRESAIYLCASRYEPFGLAPLEAAAAGCALVCRDLPSLREIWADSALYFTDNTSLAHVLHTLASDPDLLAEAQKRARRRATQFTAARMASSYLHLFQTVLQQSQAMQHVS